LHSVLFRVYAENQYFFRAYVEIFRAYVDSNASAYSTEILRETRNKYVEDTINLPTEARTPRPGARLDRCGARLSAHCLTERTAVPSGTAIVVADGRAVFDLVIQLSRVDTEISTLSMAAFAC